MDKIQMWVNDMLVNLENMDDKAAGIALMENCGRACARMGVIPRIMEFKSANKAVSDPMEKITRLAVSFTKIKIEDGKVYLDYDQCFCPIMKTEVKKSAFYCNCSRGWVKEAFSTLIEKPVAVIMEQSINKGDHKCRFRIEF